MPPPRLLARCQAQPSRPQLLGPPPWEQLLPGLLLLLFPRLQLLFRQQQQQQQQRATVAGPQQQQQQLAASVARLVGWGCPQKPIPGARHPT
jgi:hypothetical protein